MVIPKATDITDDLARMMREREFAPAPEPDGGIGHQSEDGVAYGVSSVKSAGYVYLWNVFDYERSTFNNNAVMAKLREKFPMDHPTMPGAYAWSPYEPEEKPFRGTATCPLHPSRPEREEYDRKGHPVCNRIQLPNEFEAREHLRLKHTRTWKAMQEEVLTDERVHAAEDRTLARLAMQKLTGDVPSVEVALVTHETPEPQVISLPKFHPHRFGKTMGSKCKVSGCTEVRKVEFKARKGKNNGK